LLNDVPFYSGGGPCFELKAVYYKMYTHLFKKDNPSLPGEEIPGSFDSEINSVLPNKEKIYLNIKTNKMKMESNKE
jgi:hypothetical protein